MATFGKKRPRRFTLAKRDAAYDAIVDALNDPDLILSGWERGQLEQAKSMLITLTSRVQ
jgi:hypothetical protein